MNQTTDWLKTGREYLAANAAESGADVIIAGLCDEVGRLRDALFTAQRRFELFAAGGVRVTNGASPRLGAQEAKQALRGWRPE